ncbi:MAG: tetratricopeptide repeat protein, partial [Proteobacteria bacterium]|nr:tetratricopeptide repeat protein [Pseudomonadota bacterium]
SGTAKVASSQFIRRYITAAMGGNVGAQATLGYFYENGEHVAVDLKEAVRWYQEAAKNDHVRAILRLAQIAVESGDGPAGVEWYRRAATLGDADAQAMLGYFYQKGEHVIADPKAAIQWYLAAADQGNAAAQNNLGLVYQLGAGVPQDLDKAIYWYEQASANGSASAARNLEKLLP